MSFTPAPGERVIFSGHPSWKAIIPFYLKGIGIAVLAGLIASLVDLGFFRIFLLVFIVFGITALIGFVKRWATIYTISDRRLNIKRGVFAREIQETRLDRIQNVAFTQGAVQRLLGIGDVDFDTASTGGSNMFVFGGVDRPEDVVAQVDEAIRTGRQTVPAGP